MRRYVFVQGGRILSVLQPVGTFDPYYGGDAPNVETIGHSVPDTLRGVVAASTLSHDEARAVYYIARPVHPLDSGGWVQAAPGYEWVPLVVRYEGDEQGLPLLTWLGQVHSLSGCLPVELKGYDATCVCCGRASTLTVGLSCVRCFGQLVRYCVGTERRHACRAIGWVADLPPSATLRDAHQALGAYSPVVEGVSESALSLTFPQLFGLPSSDTIEESEDGPVCEDHSFPCDDCGTVRSSQHYAQTCCWFTCGQCGEPYEYEESALNCCYESSSDEWSYVHNYTYRPTFRYYTRDSWTFAPADKVLYLGFELELERAAPHVEAFYIRAGEEWNDERFVYCKSDGSLGSEGVELVTQPATLEAHRERFPWDALQGLHQDGARSYRYASCGMHIHVARSSFVDAPHVWRFVTFQLRNKAFVSVIGQRADSQYAQWSTSGTLKIDGKSLPELVKGKTKNGNRYVAINFQNDATIELRYMKGNILKDAILRKLEMVAAIHAYTANLDSRAVLQGALTWDRFVDYVAHHGSDYPALLHYLLNNPTDDEDK